MTRIAKTTTRSLRNLAGKRGIVRLAFQKQMSVRVNAIGMRPNKRHKLPGENLQYHQHEVFILVEAVTHGAYGSRRPDNAFTFLLPIRKGETPHQLIQRALRSRCKKRPVLDRTELQIV